VNLHLFNGGMLDDRDPDGSGPLKSHFAQRLGELVTEVGPLVLYNTYSSLNTSAFDNWVAPGTGRRSYLLGTTAGRQMLRDAGFWPLTEPPVFSQFGLDLRRLSNRSEQTRIERHSGRVPIAGPGPLVA